MKLEMQQWFLLGSHRFFHDKYTVQPLHLGSFDYIVPTYIRFREAHVMRDNRIRIPHADEYD